jgi:hypothetical protein
VSRAATRRRKRGNLWAGEGGASFRGLSDLVLKMAGLMIAAKLVRDVSLSQICPAGVRTGERMEPFN